MKRSNRLNRFLAWASFAGVTLRLGALFAFFAFGVMAANAQTVLLDPILTAQRAKTSVPQSIQMTGTVERNGKKTEAFRLIATSGEQVRIDYGTSDSSAPETLVLSPKAGFHRVQDKVTYARVPPGFAQLDITGLFFVEQLLQRPVRIESGPVAKVANTAGQSVQAPGAKVPDAPVSSTQRLAVSTERSEIHQGTRVNDRADLYMDQSGVLVGISRSFYEGRPDAYTQTLAFSDFRDTDGVLLPYQIDMYVQSRKAQTYHIDKYGLDIPVDKDLFLGRRAQ